MTEADVDSVMVGADKMGERFKFKDSGRVILSSLELDTTSGKQFIHWQRCFGSLKVNSDYGNDSTNNGLNGPVLVSMGSGVNKAKATANQAVMFVEVVYDYKPIVPLDYLGYTNRTLRFTAAFNVRERTNYVLYNAKNLTGTAFASCTVYAA